MSGFFKRYVLHNFWLKVLSLIMATGLWVFVSPDEQTAEVAVRAPIVFLHVPSNLEISTENIPEAQIRVRGPERVIRHLLANDVRAEIELGQGRPEERTFDLSAQQVRHPRELAVVQIVPSQVRLSFDTRLTRQVKIEPRVIGNFATVDVDPKTITITGPKRHVERVDAATTDLVDASGAIARTTFMTNAYVADPLVQVMQPSTIQVTVTMEKPKITPAQ
jgi:YbbR domain-containing protein